MTSAPHGLRLSGGSARAAGPGMARDRLEWDFIQRWHVERWPVNLSPSDFSTPEPRAIFAAGSDSPNAPDMIVFDIAAKALGITMSQLIDRLDEAGARSPLCSPATRADVERLAKAIRHEGRIAAAEVALVAALAANGPERDPRRLAAAASELADARDRTDDHGGGVTLKTLLDADDDAAPQTLRTGLGWFDESQLGGAIERASLVALSGAPGSGKTAMALQLVFSFLLTNPTISAIWGAGEMAPKRLKDRLLSVATRLPRDLLRRDLATLTDTQRAARDRGLESLDSIASRLHFMMPPIGPARLAANARAIGASVIVVDYLQLMRSDAESDSRRGEVDSCLFALRSLVNEVNAVGLLISNLAKPNGAPVSALTLGKESSEIGYAVDLGFLAVVAEDVGHDRNAVDRIAVKWRCLKNRHGAPRDLHTLFERSTQRFVADRGTP